MKDDSNLASKFPPQVHDIFKKFEEKGFEIYVVGGIVRDLLLNRESYDWDFTTNAPPEKILEILPEGFYDNQFGTVGLVVPGFERPFEITTYRTEQGYSDKRR